MKNAKFEIYEGLTWRKKKYLVFTKTVKATDAIVAASKKFFKCSIGHLQFSLGYVCGDNLYFGYPGKVGSTQVLIVTYVK